MLLALLHAINTTWISSRALKQIDQRATQAETQLETRTEQLKKPEVQAQVEQRLSQLERAIESGQVPQAQLRQAQAQVGAIRARLQALKENPETLEEQRDAELQQIRSSQEENKKQAETNFWKSGIKTCLSSLLLGIGYTVIGWTGLRSLEVR